MSYVDLHIHSTCSDGTDSPEQLVALAAEQHLTTIALTDHDTVSGICRAQSAGVALGVEVLAGIEISTEWQGTEIHLLGYFIAPDSPSLRPVLDWVVEDRDRRNERIVALLQRDGYSISMEQLRRDHPNTVIGRPHMAQALLQAGAVSSIQEAFQRLLAEGCPYFLPRTYIPFRQAAEVIYAAGGVPVLAHPLQYGYPPEGLEALVRTAKCCGAVGLEVWYSGYTPQQQQQLMALGRKYDLIFTGGSDYHGTRKPHIQLGTGTGDLRVPQTAAEDLKRVWCQKK